MTVCSSLINAAVEIASRVKGHRTENFDFLPVGRPDPSLDAPQSGVVRLHLDEAAFNRKLAAANAYPELGTEVRSLMDEMGAAAFQAEYLRPVTNDARSNDDFAGVPPFYEPYGEKQVAAGIYREVIRYRDHVLPISEALMDYAQR